MTNDATLFPSTQESSNKLFLGLAAFLAVLPLALYIAITFFKAPIFQGAWGVAIMPGWPLALFLTIQGLPNARAAATATDLPADRAAAGWMPAARNLRVAAS